MTSANRWIDYILGEIVPGTRHKIQIDIKPVRLPCSEWLTKFTAHMAHCICRAGKSIAHMQQWRHHV